MKLRGLIDEDFSNYKKPSMFIIFPYCNLKCDIENGSSICQNSSLLKEDIIEVDVDRLINRYLHNGITKSIVCGGLEPIDSFDDLIELISVLRNKYHCLDDVVIYTGYTQEEITSKIIELSSFRNIVIKFGRFIPNQLRHFDDVLGVDLASDNQYAIRYE